MGRRAIIEAGAVSVLAALWLYTWLPRLEGPIDLRWDSAVYYTLGTALAEGKGYRLLNEPGEVPAVQTPPGLPAVIAAHQRLLGTSDPVVVGIALRRFYLSISALYAVAVYALIRSSFGVAAGLAGAAVCILSLTVIWVSDRAYTDLPFVLAATACVLFSRWKTPAARIGTGAAAVAAFLLRTVGAALLVGWIAEAAFARNWRRTAIRLAMAGVLLGGWQAYVWTTQQSAGFQNPAYPYQRAPYLQNNVTYTAHAALKRPFFPELGYASAGDRGRRFLSNVANLPAAIGEVLSTSSENWYSYLEPYREVPILGLGARWRVLRTGLAALGLMTLAGAWLLFRRGHVLTPAAVAVFVLGVCAMNFNEEFGRYLTGIQPLFVLLLLTTLLGAQSLERPAGLRVAVIGAVFAAMFAGEITTLARAYPEDLTPVTQRWSGRDVTYKMFSYSESSRGLDAAIEWLAGRAGPEEVIASSQPHWVHLRSGRRRAVMPPFERNPFVQQALLDSVPITYVIVDSNGFSATREYSLPALRDETRWRLVFQTADGPTDVYERIRPAFARTR